MPNPSVNVLVSGKPKKIFPTIASLLPYHRYRASAAVGASSVTSIPNEGSAGGSFVTQAGTIALPVDEPKLNNAKIIQFSGTQEMRSNQALSAWKFMHDGTDYTMFVVAFNYQFYTGNANATADPGFFVLINTSYRLYTVNSPPNTSVLNSSGDYSSGSILRYIYTFATKTYSVHRNAVFGASVALGGGVHSSANPTYNVSMGRTAAGTYYSGGKFAELLIFNRLLNADELAAVDSELFITYGVHA